MTDAVAVFGVQVGEALGLTSLLPPAPPAPAPAPTLPPAGRAAVGIGPTSIPVTGHEAEHVRVMRALQNGASPSVGSNSAEDPAAATAARPPVSGPSEAPSSLPSLPAFLSFLPKWFSLPPPSVPVSSPPAATTAAAAAAPAPAAAAAAPRATSGGAAASAATGGAALTDEALLDSSWVAVRSDAVFMCDPPSDLLERSRLFDVSASKVADYRRRAEAIHASEERARRDNELLEAALAASRADAVAAAARH